MLYRKIVDTGSKSFAGWFKAERKLISCANYLEYALKLNSFIDSERKSVQYGLK
jgi:hypothetical protein